MNRIVIALLKPFSFIPAILMMSLIFSFSSQNGTESSQLSEKVARGIFILFTFLTFHFFQFLPFCYFLQQNNYNKQKK